MDSCEFRNIELDSTYGWVSVVEISRASLMITYTKFENVTGGGGVGLYDGSVNVHGCEFQNMKAKRGTGLYLTRGSLAISDTTFQDLQATTGSAIYGSFCSAILTRIRVAHCTSNNGNLQFLNSTVNITDS